MGKRGNPLTPTKIDQIIELKLEQVSVREIAAAVGCDKDTVSKYWHQWLDETAEERREHLERHRSEVIARLGSVARRARVEAAGSPADRVRFLGEERQAWRALSTVAGFDAPTRIQLATFDTMTEEEAAAALDKL